LFIVENILNENDFDLTFGYGDSKADIGFLSKLKYGIGPTRYIFSVKKGFFNFNAKEKLSLLGKSVKVYYRKILEIFFIG
jgi:hypothetical protein